MIVSFEFFVVIEKKEKVLRGINFDGLNVCDGKE